MLAVQPRCKQTGEAGMIRRLTNKLTATYWLNRCIVFAAAALLVALALTQFARYARLDANHAEVTAGTMGRGGQFEKALLW
jgi:hypothetical protein